MPIRKKKRDPNALSTYADFKNISEQTLFLKKLNGPFLLEKMQIYTCTFVFISYKITQSFRPCFIVTSIYYINLRYCSLSLVYDINLQASNSFAEDVSNSRKYF